MASLKYYKVFTGHNNRVLMANLEHSCSTVIRREFAIMKKNLKKNAVFFIFLPAGDRRTDDGQMTDR